MAKSDGDRKKTRKQQEIKVGKDKSDGRKFPKKLPSFTRSLNSKKLDNKFLYLLKRVEI